MGILEQTKYGSTSYNENYEHKPQNSLIIYHINLWIYLYIWFENELISNYFVFSLTYITINDQNKYHIYR